VDSTNDMLEKRICDLLDEVGSDSPLPGAGSVAALATAMAAGLLEMAARRSAANWPEAVTVYETAAALRARATELAPANAAAYEAARQGLVEARERGPLADSESLGSAMLKAADVPLLIAEVAAEVASLADAALDRVDPDVRADVVAAAALSAAAARAAAHLVEVNLVAGDADDMAARARVLRTNADRCAGRVLAAVG
jgi:formiminotetrahydrofolate cyclodeaminase